MQEANCKFTDIFFAFAYFLTLQTLISEGIPFLAMAQASDSYQLIELRDPHFLLDDGLAIASTTEGCEGSLEEMSGEFSKHLISPKSVSRLLIERGEYPAVPICFQYPAEVIAGWSDWVCYEAKEENFDEAFCSAGIKLSLFISGFCEICKDDVCLRHFMRRWSPETHTFVCSWGEFTPTLEDVCNIMRIPIFGVGNLFKMKLDEAQNKKLKILKKGACSFREVFSFCNWVRHFWGSNEGGKVQNGEGFNSGCRVEAMLAYWLSKFIFTDFPHEHVQERVFPLAIKLADGVRFPLAPLFLSHLYKKLDQIAKDEREGAGQYGICTLVSTFFLQVFVWERFKGLGVKLTKPKSLCQLDKGRIVFNLMEFPLCFRWHGKKAKKGAFRPAVMDKIEQFNFRPYLNDHGFLRFTFFHPENGLSPHRGLTELLLTTAAQSIVACDDLFGPSMEKYSPHRVRRQFGIDQDVPSHLPFGGHIGNCIVAFTQTVVTSCQDKLSGSLGKKGSAGSATLSFLGFWKQQQCEFVKFIKTGGTRLRPNSNNENKRLLCSKTVMGIMSKLNLPYFEVYSDSSECLVGHLKGVKGGRNRCATKSNVKFPENGEKGKNGKIRRFKPKVVNDRIPSSTVKSTKGVKLVPPLKLADGTEKKRKAAPASRLSGAVKKKAAPDASNVLLRRSPRVADMTQSKLKLYVDDDLTDGQDDDSEDSEGSPLSEDASMHEDNDSGASGEGTSDDDNQTKSFEGKDSEDDEGESNSTSTPIEGSNSHSTAVSMEDYEHGVSGDNNVDAQEREPAINVAVYEDNCGEQACKAVETCHGADTQVNEPAVNFGVCGDNCGEQGESGEVLLETGGTMRGDNNIDAAALVNREVPSCTTSTISSTLDSDKAGNDSPTDLEARFRDFVACFDAKDSLSITVDSITKPLSGNQSPFEGGMVPSEFVVPLTKFAQKYGGGSFSSLFAEGKSTYQKHTLVERFGLLLYSMEVEEVKHEGTFLVWRDLCHDVVDWGLKVGFMFDHLKQAARSFFGYKLKPAGSDNYCKEVLQLEKSVLELRSELVRLEKQLGKAREGLCSKFGNVICPDDVMACILESSWTPQSRATHGLY